MVERPNRAVLNDALDEYRDAMRPFIVRVLKRVRGKSIEDAIYDTLSPKQADKFELRLQSNSGNVEGAIDIGDFPNLIIRNWREVFGQQFNGDMSVQSLLHIITPARNKAVHPDTGDLETEYTRVVLYHIVDVLGRINAPEPKASVEEFRDTLSIKPKASKLLIPDEGKLRSSSSKGERYRSYFQGLIDELREQHGFTGTRVGRPQNWYFFSSGVGGITYKAKFARNHKVYASLYINLKTYAESKNFFDVLKERESEITAQFDIPLNWERKDETLKSVIRLIRDGDINADESELAAIKEWHIAYLLKLKAVFTPEIERARETLQSP